MEKLDKVIAGLTGCLVGNCSNCEYGGDGCHGSDMLEDALELLKDYRELKWKHKLVKDGRLELARRCRELEDRLSWLEPRTTPNDWGEYPPEFPREGM